MKRLNILIIFLMIVFVGSVAAEDGLGVFASLNTGSIQYINPMTHEVSEPLLRSELGDPHGGLLDVAITPDGTKAVVSNFGDSRIFVIDITGGFDGTPTVLGSVYTTMSAEDIAITPDGKYALITDGALGDQIGVFDLATQSLVKMNNIGTLSAQAISITPDGQLVVVADYLGGAIHSFWLDSNGNLTFKETQLIMPFWPVNIAISPDGKTLLAPIAFNSVLPVFLIDSQHNLCFKEFIPLPSRGSQSCVFSYDGAKAYLLLNGNPAGGTLVSILNVTGPGQVSASGTAIVVEPTRDSGQFFGVDTIALGPNGNYLYVTNPTGAAAVRQGVKTSPPNFHSVAGVSVLDLTTNTQVNFLDSIGIPTGIAFTSMDME